MRRTGRSPRPRSGDIKSVPGCTQDQRKWERFKKYTIYSSCESVLYSINNYSCNSKHFFSVRVLRVQFV